MKLCQSSASLSEILKIFWIFLSFKARRYYDKIERGLLRDKEFSIMHVSPFERARLYQDKPGTVRATLWSGALPASFNIALPYQNAVMHTRQAATHTYTRVRWLMYGNWLLYVNFSTARMRMKMRMRMMIIVKIKLWW